MKNEKNGHITKEDLSEQTQIILGAMDKRFDKVENRLDKVEDKLGNVGNKINQIDRRLFSIEKDISDIKVKHYGDLHKRVSFIEKKLGFSNG